MRSHRIVRSVLLLVVLATSTACGSVYAQGRTGSPSYPTYPGPRDGGYRRTMDVAYTRGYDDGYRQGVDAARDGDRYDVRRESWYRSADRGYERRYGSREAWRRVYRDGFESGYDRGYREARARRGRW